MISDEMGAQLEPLTNEEAVQSGGLSWLGACGQGAAVGLLLSDPEGGCVAGVIGWMFFG